ncbi:MAG: DUF1800 domain-containing protein [Rhodobacter sp.]|nr:DUF1800 domain-containing protein [Rhodobacter sp.]
MELYDRPIGPETYAAIRFGTGFPLRGAPATAEAMLNRLAGPDRVAAAYPRLSFDEGIALGTAVREAMRQARKNMAGGAEAVKVAHRALAAARGAGFVLELARHVETDDPFRERLVRFWENHFAAASRRGAHVAAASGYADEAIRPHIAGPFSTLLKSAVTHPFLMMYLDQPESVGPNSRKGLRHGRGLNENLAREVLELHTLGVGGPYTQADVTEFAELLTGLHFTGKKGFAFQPGMAEPGAETVLGRTYGGDKPELADIHAVLDDLAVHPSTAAFVCRKLAVHFVADDPDPDLIAFMQAAYRVSGGHLTRVYAAMLEHPASWRGFGAKVKTPMEFMTSGLRALGARAADLDKLGPNHVRKRLLRPLRLMGQPYQRPPGPDGFADDAEAWVQPFGLAGRIGWAMRAARSLGQLAPDPREFVRTALGDATSGRLIWAAGAAETRPDGVGVVLASAEFNRR